MWTLIQLLLGALSGLIFIPLARRAGPTRELMVYAVALDGAALVYVGFAFVGGATSAWTAVELVGVALFSLAALPALKGRAWPLAVGWAIHPAWDVLLHGTPRALFVPEWYPVVCAGFDLLLAAYIATSATGRARSGSRDGEDEDR